MVLYLLIYNKQLLYYTAIAAQYNSVLYGTLQIFVTGTVPYRHAVRYSTVHVVTGTVLHRQAEQYSTDQDQADLHSVMAAAGPPGRGRWLSGGPGSLD